MKMPRGVRQSKARTVNCENRPGRALDLVK